MGVEICVRSSDMEECAAGREFGSGSGSAQEMLGCLTILGDHTHAQPRLSRIQCPQLEDQSSGGRLFYSLGRVSRLLGCASLLIGTKEGASGVEVWHGLVLVYPPMAAGGHPDGQPPSSSPPRHAINRGVVWFAINQSSHKYPTEAKTAKVR